MNNIIPYTFANGTRLRITPRSGARASNRRLRKSVTAVVSVADFVILHGAPHLKIDEIRGIQVQDERTGERLTFSYFALEHVYNVDVLPAKVKKPRLKAVQYEQPVTTREARRAHAKKLHKEAAKCTQ